MIKIVIKGKGDEVKCRTKVRCKGTKRLVAETVAVVAAVCMVAQGHNEKFTPEMVMNMAKDVLEGKKGPLKEDKADADE